MKKCVVLMSVAFCISLGAVRAQTNLVGEHIEGGWYYSLYDDYGEKTAILTHVLEALDVRDLQIPEEVFDLGSYSYYMDGFSFSGVMSGPNWPTKAGATAAMTRSPWLMDWMTWKIWLLSAMAPKGQFTRHMPQDTHLS